MNSKSFTVSLKHNPAIAVKVIPGHFTTSHFHLTHYLDLDNLKNNSSLARAVAKEFARPYLSTTPIDTIVCMEGTELIGAYLAEELKNDGLSVVNADREIYVLTPLNNVHKQLMFQSNTQELIVDHNVLLLVTSISSGITVKSALDCLAYYGGNLVGISALYKSYDKELEQKFHYLFTSEDVPGYKMFSPGKCEMCESGRKLDAIIMHGGYTKI